MKNYFLAFFIFFSIKSFSQNVTVDSQTYTPQQLIEDILINSDCITDIVVSNVVGGNFGGYDQSYGYFEANGSSFPFDSGLVLSTGRLQNVPGPNTTLSDDDAPNWGGDQDLENILDESNTTNATILEFDFVSVADQIKFRYIFASEEYQEGNSNTCQYSDLFGFLIRPADQQQYTNIALVPNTQTPVKVTTVHSGIPGGCNPINEEYFGSWNGPSAPINFNGQTSILTAEANVIPNQTYHVKLVIADEQNYRYDSAVFLEAGSFQLGSDLGPDRLISTGNPLCEGESLILSVEPSNGASYLWYKEGDPIPTIPCLNCTEYEVTEAGTYHVEVNLENNCISYGEITIEYSENPNPTNANLVNCDFNGDGLSTYNLLTAEEMMITNNDQFISGFYNSLEQAQEEDSPIENMTNYSNSSLSEVVYARVENTFGCFAISEITLDVSQNDMDLEALTQCDDSPNDGFADFNLSAYTTEIQALVPNGSQVSYFYSLEDAELSVNSLPSSYTNEQAYYQTIYVRIDNNSMCYSIAELILQVYENPVLPPDEEIKYCTNSYPETITLSANPNNAAPLTYEWTLNGMPLGFDTPNIEINQVGTYSVSATNLYGCSAIRNFDVLASEPAQIENIQTTEAPSTLTVNVTGNGDYLFGLDGGQFQLSHIFFNVPAGFHTVQVLNLDGCGTVTEEVAILGFPKFFTPNGDGENDTWNPYGVSTEFYGMTIQIFDRYGKLLTTLLGNDAGWSGFYENQLMPSNDYWYKATLPNGKVYLGHFALIR